MYLISVGAPRDLSNEGNSPTVSSSSAHPPSVLLEKSASLGNEKFSSEAGAMSQSVRHCTVRILTVVLLTQVEEMAYFYMLHVSNWPLYSINYADSTASL